MLKTKNPSVAAIRIRNIGNGLPDTNEANVSCLLIRLFSIANKHLFIINLVGYKVNTVEAGYTVHFHTSFLFLPI